MCVVPWTLDPALNTVAGMPLLLWSICRSADRGTIVRFAVEALPRRREQSQRAAMAQGWSAPRAPNPRRESLVARGQPGRLIPRGSVKGGSRATPLDSMLFSQTMHPRLTNDTPTPRHANRKGWYDVGESASDTLSVLGPHSAREWPGRSEKP